MSGELYQNHAIEADFKQPRRRPGTRGEDDASRRDEFSSLIAGPDVKNEPVLASGLPGAQ